MPSHTIEEIAKALEATVAGDATLTVIGASEPGTALRDQLAVAMDQRYADDLQTGDAICAILWPGADWQSLGLKAAIFVERPRMAMARLTRHLNDTRTKASIHPTALIDLTARIGENAMIGAYVTIAVGVTVGARCQIASHTSIAEDVHIGDDALIQSGVRIGRNVRIGDHFMAHPGVVIGSDGFSFVTAEESAVEQVRDKMRSASDTKTNQTWEKIYSLGGVEIGDHVEIGANSTIDAGTLRATRIGSGSKLDALVQIAHNVSVGENCLLCGQVGIAGSTVIGNNVVLGGQTGVADNTKIGDGVIAGGATKIYSNVPAGRAILGSPAVKMETHIASYKAIRRLPRLFSDVKRLQDIVSKSDPED